MKFDFLDRPSEETIVRALEQLYSIKAIDLNGELTQNIGAKLAEFPIEPRLAFLLLNSCKIIILFIYFFLILFFF